MAEGIFREKIVVGELDVTRPEACEEVVKKIALEGGLGVLVNNAGHGLMGPMEELSEDDLRHQFEVNYFGVMRLCRLALPHMRDQGGGTIVNIGSIVGRFTFPVGGAYCSSKHAIEALCDAMRIEVAPFGVRVVLVEPGPIETRFKTNSGAHSAKALAHTPDSPYRTMKEHAMRVIEGNRGWPGASPDRVASVIVKACLSRSPRARYVVTARGHMMIALRRLLPDSAWDFLIGKALQVR